MADALATLARFAAAFAEADVRLPLKLSDEDVGVVLDADGRDVLTVDVNGERPNDQAAAIASLLVEAVNGIAAPVKPAGGGSAHADRPTTNLDLRPFWHGDQMKRSPARIMLLRQLAADGATVSEAAHALDLSIPTIQRWAVAELINFPTRSQARKKALADPEVRARMSEARKKALADPEVRARMSEASKKALADPEVRARMSEASKKAWADPEVRARMSEARKKALADPEVRARMSEASKKALADPEVRARMSEASKKALADPEVRARMSEARKKAWADPEVRARMSEASKKALADPEVRARMSEASKKAWADPEVRARMSEARKKALADPEVRARMKAARRGKKGILVPAWVPLDLQDEFLDVAELEDEFAAARHIRRLKQEMAQPRVARASAPQADNASADDFVPLARKAVSA